MNHECSSQAGGLICIAGKNNIAVDTLQYLLSVRKIPAERIVVICNRTETGRNTWQRSLRLFAKESGVREVSLAQLYEEKELLFLSLEYDCIVKPQCFRSKWLYNIHFSLLPHYKGMYTSAMPILNNEKSSGVTFHEIDAGIDTGNIILQKEFVLNETDTARDLYLNYIRYGTSLVKEAVDKLLDSPSRPEGKPQQAEYSSYYSRAALNYGQLRVDLNQTARHIQNQIRAFHFREYQLPQVNGKKINRAVITDIRSKNRPGRILWESDDRMRISAIDYDMVLYVDQFDRVLQMCRHGDLDGLMKIHGLETYVNQQGENGLSPLMAAVSCNQYEIVQFLLTEGADIKITDWDGRNLLMYAKDTYVQFHDTRLAEFFWEMGLDVEQTDYNGKNFIDYCKDEGLGTVGAISVFH